MHSSVNNQKNDVYPYDVFVGGILCKSTPADIYNIIYSTNVLDVYVRPSAHRNPSFYRVSVKTEHVANVIVKQLNGKYIHSNSKLQVCLWHQRYGFHREKMRNIVKEAKETLNKRTDDNISMEIMPVEVDAETRLPHDLLWSEKWGYHKKKQVTLIQTYKLVHVKDIIT